MYHGDLPLELKNILKDIAKPQLDRSWVYTGTLDDFDSHWNPSLWCVMGNTIFVTQHDGWGER